MTKQRMGRTEIDALQHRCSEAMLRPMAFIQLNEIAEAHGDLYREFKATGKSLMLTLNGDGGITCQVSGIRLTLDRGQRESLRDWLHDIG